jgi:hypothetical protein
MCIFPTAVTVAFQSLDLVGCDGIAGGKKHRMKLGRRSMIKKDG